ncbi:MAG: hypothetical protein IT438_01765 [Phycisphaerales bacterium]|nr:hypothetical protein [Phycisphaerales bacterium]
MLNRLFHPPATTALLAVAVATLPGCARSRAEVLRDRSATVERKLVSERDRVLANPTAADHESKMSHLQTMRVGLSMINVSIAAVPLMLADEAQREVGYSVLDEALGTIDWNIPIYISSPSTAQRDYPTLFSPLTGLDFAGIRRGDKPQGIR